MITAATSAASKKALQTQCPLCGVAILSVSNRGVVIMEELRPVALFSPRGMGQGYLVCEDCFTLTGLTAGVTLN